MKNNDSLEEELETTLAKLYARDSDSDTNAEQWHKLSEDLADDKDFRPPPVNKKFDRRIRKALKQQAKKRFKGQLKRHRILVTVVLIILLAVPATVLAVNKEEVYNFFISVFDEHTTIKNKSEAETYKLDYLPNGYEFAECSTNGSIYTTIYANEQGDKISFWQYDSSAAIQFDTEEAELVQKIKILDIEAFLVEKDGLCKLIWNTNPQFVLTGNLDKEEIIKIAEKIKRSD